MLQCLAAYHFLSPILDSGRDVACVDDKRIFPHNQLIVHGCVVCNNQGGGEASQESGQLCVRADPEHSVL